MLAKQGACLCLKLRCYQYYRKPSLNCDMSLHISTAGKKMFDSRHSNLAIEQANKKTDERTVRRQWQRRIQSTRPHRPSTRNLRVQPCWQKIESQERRYVERYRTDGRRNEDKVEFLMIWQAASECEHAQHRNWYVSNIFLVVCGDARYARGGMQRMWLGMSFN